MSPALGVFGGTFDPIHLGHLRAAETAREALRLDRVAFVPARVPPHRPEPSSSPLDRFTMVALATAGHSQFVASDVELRREGPSYTVDTLEALLRDHPEDRLVLIVGSDTFPEIETWMNPDRLRALCRVAVVARSGQEGPPPFRHDRGGAPGHADADHVEGVSLPISSTDIRRWVRQGRSIRYLVPEVVADYIAKRGLYR